MLASHKPFYGIVLIIIAVFLMSIQDAIFKHLSDDYVLWQLFTLRALMAFPLFILVFRFQRQSGDIWRAALKPWGLLRAVLCASSYLVAYTAIPFVSLSTIAAGYYTAPIFVALLSVVFLKASIGIRGWVAVLMGFVGVLVILRPGSDAFSLWTLCPVIAGFAYAVANLITSRKCQSIPATALALSLNLSIFSLGVGGSLLLLIVPASPSLVSDFSFLFSGWSALQSTTWVFISMLACLVIGIGISTARAYQTGSPPTIATFEYAYLIFVALWDLVIFNAPPSLMTLPGIALIVASGMIIARRPQT